MPDHPTEQVDLVAAIICQHSLSRQATVGGHAQQYECRCGNFRGTWRAWSKHVAAALDAATPPPPDVPAVVEAYRERIEHCIREGERQLAEGKPLPTLDEVGERDQ